MNIQNNAEESTTTAYSIQTNEEYAGTPLMLRGNEETGYYATLGAYKLTENFTTLDNLKNILNQTNIRLIIAIAMTIAQTEIKINEDTKKLTEQLEKSEIPCLKK